MTDRLSLPPRYRRMVEELLRTHVPDAEVWAYGSRVSGENHEGSDLDLVVRGPTLEPMGVEFIDLVEALQESDIPILVQAHDWAGLPDGFHREIEREYVVVQGGPKQKARSEWREVTLDQLGRIVTGKTPSSRNPQYFGGDILFVTPRDFDGRRRIDSTERCLTDQGLSVITGACISRDSVMVSCIGSDMGKAAIAARCSVTNQQINTIVVYPENDPLFVYYNLSNRKDEIRGAAGGSAQPILNKSAFGQMPMLLPPLPEQRAIAHVLGTLDDKIELNRRMNETLEAMARALFKSWFVDFEPVRAKMEGRWRRGESLPGLPAEHYDLFPERLVDSELGEIPDGWEVKELGEVTGIHDSKRIPLNSRQRAERHGTYPYYGAAGIMDYVDDYLFDGVYVLIGEDGSVVDDEGYPIVQYVWGQFWVNNHAHVLTGKSPMTNEHLFMLLWQIEVLPYVTGAVQPKLSQTNLKSIPIVAAPDEVCRAFSGVIQPFFTSIRILTNQSRVLAAQRGVLLPGLVSGEVGCAND